MRANSHLSEQNKLAKKKKKEINAFETWSRWIYVSLIHSQTQIYIQTVKMQVPVAIDVYIVVGDNDFPRLYVKTEVGWG
jgi:hypothetical protein